MPKITFTDDFLSIQQCQDNPDTIYLFGDNLEGWGNAGQASIRKQKNAHGIPTKLKPSMSEDAFFSDEQLEDYKWYLSSAETHLRYLLTKGYTKVVCHKQIGKGLADMPNRSPQCYVALLEFLLNFEF
jgi:hypothetical protein